MTAKQSLNTQWGKKSSDQLYKVKLIKIMEVAKAPSEQINGGPVVQQKKAKEDEKEAKWKVGSNLTYHNLFLESASLHEKT